MKTVRNNCSNCEKCPERDRSMSDRTDIAAITDRSPECGKTERLICSRDLQRGVSNNTIFF